MQKHPLNGKVALVTGAARRVGADISRILHEAGMNLALHYNVSEDEAIKLSEELNKKRPHSAITIQAELIGLESEKILIQEVLKAWDRLDVLVNNASRFYRTGIDKVTEYAWDDLMNSNLKAPFFLALSAAPFLQKHKGCIVNITDVNAERPLNDYPVYCISKGGLIMMTKVLAKELAPNVRVNAVSPGAVMWPEGDNKLSDTEKKQIIERTYLQKAGDPKDIAKAVLFFVRDAEYITGQILNVDGGSLLT